VLCLSALEALCDNVASHFTAASKHGGGESARASFETPKANRKKVIFENMMSSIVFVSKAFRFNIERLRLRAYFTRLKKETKE
jgi:hypothetical protein